MEQNFLLLFRRDHPLDSSVEFMKIWREYDSDHSGYIEADELKNFLHDLLKRSKKDSEVTEEQLIIHADTMLQLFDRNRDGKLQLSEMAKEHQETDSIVKSQMKNAKDESENKLIFNDLRVLPVIRDVCSIDLLTKLKDHLEERLNTVIVNVISEKASKDAKKLVLTAFDENNDGRIDIAELAQILQKEQNFLLLFRRDHPLDSSVEFMKIWREYDSDHSGYIEADELKNFLHDLLKRSKKDSEVTEEQLIIYADTMLQLFDRNRDGKLQLSEMAKLLPVKENFLCRPIFKGCSRLSTDDIDRVFNLYDVDRNGYIENEELHGFLKDLMELVGDDYDADDLLDCQKILLDKCDLDQDGKINKEELTMVLTSCNKTNQSDDASLP